VVRSKGNLAFSHQLIHNHGKKGFSTNPKPGSVSFETLAKLLEHHRTMFRLAVTRDVFNYSTSSVIHEREAHNRSHKKLLREQDAI